MNKTVRKFALGFRHEWLRVFFMALIFLFALLPMLSLAFQIKGRDISFLASDNNFHQAFWNSVGYSLAASAITVLIALFCAYFLNQSSLKHKNLLATFLTLGMLVPTLSIGLGIRSLFGANGFLDKAFGLNSDVLGIPGLIIGSVCSAFPTAFLLIYDALRYENKSPYDAASVMGIGKHSTFFKLTIPYLKITLISTFFATFTLIFSDYGIPMELAGKTGTLPMYLYNSILSEFQYGRGSVAGLLLLIPALISFVFDIFFKDESAEEKQKRLIKPSKLFNIVACACLVIISVVLFLPQFSFIFLTFIKAYPNDMSFTLDNYRSLFFSAGSGNKIWKYLGNSVLMSTLTALAGTALAFGLGYVVSRESGKFGKVVNLFAVSTISIPGIVLGIGYMLIFKSTKPVFYGTIGILIVANVFHYLGSPYLMAKNGLAKLNKDYERIGETIGISSADIVLKVVIPNSLATIVEIFSYYFLSSMITISAVAFLSTYNNQPLSILITVYEKTENYEMQGAISAIILITNVLAKALFAGINAVIKNKQKEGEDMITGLNRYQFNLLTHVEENERVVYNVKQISDSLKLSISTTAKLVKDALENDLIEETSDEKLRLTENGLSALKPYKARKAVILAAGFGSRLAPVTLDTPKPLIRVKGVRVIDTLIDALLAKGIDDIVVVRGYKKNAFDALLEKYPTIRFIDNPEFNTTNSISSLVLAKQFVDQCYICDADLFIQNPNIIKKYQFASCFYAAKVNETDDWCFKKVNGFAANHKLGGEDCYQSFGISYWDLDDSVKLQKDIVKVYESRGGKENFWEAVPLKYYKKSYKAEIFSCHKEDLSEIDSLQDLTALDEAYKQYPGYNEY